MNQYHKIHTLFKRDPETHKVLWGQFSKPEMEFLQDNCWVFTEKVDGTNIRVMYEGNKITFGGKTDNAQLHSGLVQRLHERFQDPLKFAEAFGPGTPVCFYGEGYGAGIQKGKCYREDKDFVLFDIKVGSMWLPREEVEKWGREFGLDVVPIVGEGTIVDMVASVPTLQSTWGEFKAEGIVARPKVELKNQWGERIITKLKQVDFK